MKGLLFTTVITLLVSLGGCTIFPSHEPSRVMDFSLQDLRYRADEARPHSLRIVTPSATEPFASSRILAKPNAWEFRIYEGVRWRDTAPIIVRDMLVQAIRASEGFRDVISDTSPAEADWSLITVLSAFQTERQPNNSVQVAIKLHARIFDGKSRNTVCTKGFTIDQPLAGTKIEQVIEGFNSAGTKLSESITRWAAECPLPTTRETGPPKPLSDTTP